jgi:hypothetical protein
MSEKSTGLAAAHFCSDNGIRNGDRLQASVRGTTGGSSFLRNESNNTFTAGYQPQIKINMLIM